MINRPHVGLCFVNKFFIEFRLEFAELFEYENRYALRVTAENQNFLCLQIPGIYYWQYWDGIGLGRAAYICSLFSLTSPLKNLASI
jgi:hypothetical protein